MRKGCRVWRSRTSTDIRRAWDKATSIEKGDRCVSRLDYTARFRWGTVRVIRVRADVRSPHPPGVLGYNRPRADLRSGHRVTAPATVLSDRYSGQARG